MKGHYRIIAATMALISACTSEDDIKPIYTVGEADNVITLRAGVSTGESDVQTRATDGNHDNHLALIQGTQAALRIDGTWTGHDPVAVSKSTTATIGLETSSGSKHNSVSIDPVLYWDDYGTADPDNKTTGRAKGLTIYGVAVDDVTTAPTVSSWTSLSWILDANQTSGWASKDLLTSNNIKDGIDGTLKFEDVKSDNASDLLVFTHAMSKVTVKLTADEGFPGYSSTPSNAVFEGNPTVKLLNFNISGTYNVETKTPSESSSHSDIHMHLFDGGASNHTATFDALVFPGNSWTDATKGTEILELNADGNIYKVTAEKLFAAMNAATPIHNSITQGYNYVLNIIVKKTKIVVEATIKDWVDVTADPVTPEINISANYGQAVNGNAFTKSFDLYRSTSMASGYDEDASTDGINPAATYTYSGSIGSWDKTIFWPNHDTHYFFRGVYPQGQTVVKVGEDEVVSVQNKAYSAETAPSDLMIALPRSTGTCVGHGYEIQTNGICATKGTITMNFEYAMSKIELRLKSTGTSGSDYVDLTKEDTKVEILQGYTKGKIKLEDGLHSNYSDSDKGKYSLSKLSTAAAGSQLTTLDAVMPQVLSDDVLFKITVANADGMHDVYYAQVNKIKGAKNDETPALITEWKHGEHYIYTLDVKKSQIFVSATITDWTRVDASDDVWM